jgi:hypothetical protein
MTKSSGNNSAGSTLEALGSQFQDLLRTMSTPGDLDLQTVVDYAGTALSGAGDAAISFIKGTGAAETVATTGELPVRVDELQYAVDEGPCVATMTESDLVWINDLAADDQFPVFSPRAVELGVRSMLSTRLFLSDNERAALNFYSPEPGAFVLADLPVAAIFGSYASLLLRNRSSEDKAARLEEALEGNREIAIAMGILMAQHRWTKSEAFDRLVQASQHLNRRLRDIAAEVNETRRMPGGNGQKRRSGS